MRAEVMAAERSADVRAASRAWRSADFITDEVLARILESFPDDRVRFGPGFRTLAFIFTGIAVLATVGLSMVWLDDGAGDPTALLLAWALIMAGLTELQQGPMRRQSAGSEAATAIAAIGLALLGVQSLNNHAAPIDAIVLLSAAFSLCAFAAWRWGGVLFFLGAAFAGYGLLAQAEAARLWWIMASVGLIPASLSSARHLRRAPSHRTGAIVVGAVAVLALYTAIHIWSFDHGMVEAFRAGAPSSPAGGDSLIPRSLSILATALLPAGLVIAGWQRREPLLLYSGLLLIGVSIATIRIYYSVMPLSFALILVGTACLGLALWLRRWLRSGEAGERDGFTADPLFDNANRTEAIRSVVAAVSFTPASASPEPATGFQGGGGRSGGGGASGTF